MHLAREYTRREAVPLPFWVFNLSFSFFSLFTTAITFHIISLSEEIGVDRAVCILGLFIDGGGQRGDQPLLRLGERPHPASICSSSSTAAPSLGRSESLHIHMAPPGWPPTSAASARQAARFRASAASSGAVFRQAPSARSAVSACRAW
ncbi:MAG: hypothetical protein R3F11_17220 [Verrucomicrobiales bacterium]